MIEYFRKNSKIKKPRFPKEARFDIYKDKNLEMNSEFIILKLLF